MVQEEISVSVPCLLLFPCSAVLQLLLPIIPSVLLQDADECRKLVKEETGKHDRESSRARRSLHDFAESNYLTQLGFVRTVPRHEGKQFQNWWYPCIYVCLTGL